MQTQQQVSPEKLFAIIGEQKTQIVLLREQATYLARLAGEKDRELKIAQGALDAIKAASEEAANEEAARS